MIALFQVDAFTDRPFAGNPAAVCLLAAPQPEQWMQEVAAEMNLPETAFLIEGDDGYGLRWFSPAVEVELCGHATLASAHVLWEEGRLAPGAEARFHTRSGLLTAKRAGQWIEMDFPAEPERPVVRPEWIEPALGVPPLYVGKNRMDYLVELPSEEAVRRVRPNMALLRQKAPRGVIVTSGSSDGRFDFVSRFFAPAAGIDEDPVTGSAHCCLGPYWQKRLGKSDLTGYQASRRGGIVKVRVEGDRTRLQGQAVMVVRGALV